MSAERATPGPPQPATAAPDAPPIDAPPPLTLLQCATAALLARYALRPDRCIGVAVERALRQLAAHPAVAADPSLTGGYQVLALAWRELLALGGPGAHH